MSLFGPVRRSVERRTGDRSKTLPLDLLFPQQRAVVEDSAKFKALLCGRRAGKTECMADDLAHGMLTEHGSLNLYIALTMGSAREIMWEPLKRNNEAHGWGFIFDESKLIVRHPNGSRLLVRGADDVRELEKLRGMKFRRIRIDECGAHRPSYLQYLVEQVLEATLMDCDGDVWLAGTCTTQAFGYFYNITTGQLPGYSVHKWTAAKNPHVDYQRFVYAEGTGLLARRGWTEDNPIFRREYLAEWVLDTERRVYRFDRARNVVDALPTLNRGDEWVYVLSADFGVGHRTAATVLAYPKLWGRETYVVEEWSASGLAPSDACTELKKLYDRYNPVVFVGDVGGMGKAYQAEWNKRFPGIPMKAAEKQQKRAALEFTSDALHIACKHEDGSKRRGLFVLRHCEQLQREWATLQWDEERQEIADGQDDDTSHACLYGYRETPAYSNAERPPAPPESVKDTTHEYLHALREQTETQAFVRGWRGR